MIKTVLDAVEGQLLSVLSMLGTAALPSFGLGEKALADLDTTPRIIWVPVGGPISGSRASGGDFVRNPGALWSRNVEIAAHVWGDDITATEELAGHLIAALHFICCGSYGVVGESWDTKGSTDEGVLCVLMFQLRMPFTREGLAQVTADLPPVTTIHLDVPQ